MGATNEVKAAPVYTSSRVKYGRVGVYSGVFDPVHAGHVAFALQARKAARLDKVYFLPERTPRHKPGAEHYAHRVAMLTQALKPHPGLEVLELPEARFTVAKTRPRLEHMLPGVRFVLLCGAQTVASMPSWPHVSGLLSSWEVCVALRADDTEEAVLHSANQLPVPPQKLYVVTSSRPQLSSSSIREGVRRHRANTQGLLASVARYIRKEWLYLPLR